MPRAPHKPRRSRAEALVAEALEAATVRRTKALKTRAELAVRLANAERIVTEMDRLIGALGGSAPDRGIRVASDRMERILPALVPVPSGPDSPEAVLARARATFPADLSGMGSIPSTGVSQHEISAPEDLADVAEGDEEEQFLPNQGGGWV